MSEAVFPIPVNLTVEESTQQVDLELAEEIVIGVAHEYAGPYTVEPTEQEQVLETDGLLMTDDVTVEAVPSDYVGSAVPRKDSEDMTVDGPTVTAPAGYYEADASATIPSGVHGGISVYVGTTNNKIVYTIRHRNATSGYYTSEDLLEDGAFSQYLQTETVTPSEQAQTVQPTDVTYYLNQVTVEAVPSDYVGSSIPRKSSADLTASGPIVTAPAGYYSDAATLTIVNATYQLVNMTANPTLSVDASGLVSAAVNANTLKQPISANGYAKTTDAVQVKATGSGTLQLDTVSGTTITPTTSEQTAVAAGKFTTGDIKVGAIPPQYIVPAGTKTITSNGTGIDVTEYAAVDVAVPAPAAWRKLYSGDLPLTYTSTGATQVAEIDLGEAQTYNASKLIWVKIRDKAGKRDGYFYGSDSFFTYFMDSAESTNYLSNPPCLAIRYNSGFATTIGQYGIYGYYLTAAGKLRLRARYNATNSLTIDGTYKIEVFESINSLIS